MLNWDPDVKKKCCSPRAHTVVHTLGLQKCQHVIAYLCLPLPAQVTSPRRVPQKTETLSSPFTSKYLNINLNNLL